MSTAATTRSTTRATTGAAVPRRYRYDTPYPMSFEQLGIAGANGFVIDGLVSRFFTDSAATTECVTPDSDPVGAVEDLSGNGSNVIQTTSANKPVYRENGGVRGFRGGLISAVQREMFLTGVDVSNPYTFICVQKHSFGASFTVSMGFDGPTGGSTEIILLNNSTDVYLSDAGSTVQVAEASNPRMTYAYRATAGGTATFGGDGLACSSLSLTTKSNPGADAAATIFLGDAGPSGGLDPSDTFFALFANVQLTADQRNMVFAYIAANFNGVIT